MTGQECRHWWHSPLGWTLSGWLGVWVLVVLSTLWTQRQEFQAKVRRELAADYATHQQQMDALWKDAVARLDSWRPAPPRPERQKWIKPRWGAK